jgi:hypothetical protein
VWRVERKRELITCGLQEVHLAAVMEILQSIRQSDMSPILSRIYKAEGGSEALDTLMKYMYVITRSLLVDFAYGFTWYTWFRLSEADTWTDTRECRRRLRLARSMLPRRARDSPKCKGDSWVAVRGAGTV